jgi:hypothetical protein
MKKALFMLGIQENEKRKKIILKDPQYSRLRKQGLVEPKKVWILEFCFNKFQKLCKADPRLQVSELFIL